MTIFAWRDSTTGKLAHRGRFLLKVPAMLLAMQRRPDQRSSRSKSDRFAPHSGTYPRILRFVRRAQAKAPCHPFCLLVESEIYTSQEPILHGPCHVKMH